MIITVSLIRNECLHRFPIWLPRRRLNHAATRCAGQHAGTSEYRKSACAARAIQKVAVTSVFRNRLAKRMQFLELFLAKAKG
eukprot:953701-Pleurochrysis_carterae.AAC.1